MDTILSLLMEPKVLAFAGPLGIACVVEGYMVVKLFSLYKTNMDARLADEISASQRLSDLVASVCSKLDTLISVWEKEVSGHIRCPLIGNDGRREGDEHKC